MLKKKNFLNLRKKKQKKKQQLMEIHQVQKSLENAQIQTRQILLQKKICKTLNNREINYRVEALSLHSFACV